MANEILNDDIKELKEVFGEGVAKELVKNSVDAEDKKKFLEEAVKINTQSGFDIDAALDTYDPSFPRYTPSEHALEFFNLMRLVNGADFEFDTPIAHYFMVDLLLNAIDDPMAFPFSEEVCRSIELNPLRLAFCASRGMAKSTLIISFFGVYSAIKGVLPNGLGRVHFYLVLAASTRGGARTNALAVRSMCEDSKFINNYFESVRYTETETEFVRKGNHSKKNRSFLIRYAGIGTGVRGTRYGEKRPDCHIRGTIVTTEYGTYPVEEHPGPKSRGHFEICKEVKVNGLVKSEIVSRDHKYWGKVHVKNTDITNQEVSNELPRWVSASELTSDYWIGSRIYHLTDDMKSIPHILQDSDHWPQVHISNGVLWRQVKSVEDTKEKHELVAIQCNNFKLEKVIGEKHAYETLFGISKNCIIMDDIILNEAAAYSKTISSNIDSLIYSDAEAALKGGGKGRIIMAFTPFHYQDNNVRTITSKAYCPCLIPLSKSFDIDALKLKDIQSSWPAMHPNTSILQMAIGARRAKKVRAFLQERMLRLASGSDRLIPDDQIKFRRVKDIIDNINAYRIYITTDYTTTSGEKSDFSGIAAWAVDCNRTFYMLDIALRRMSMKEQYSITLNMAKRYKALGANVEIGVEIDGNQAAHIYSLEQEMQKRNDYYMFARDKNFLDSKRKGILSRGSGLAKHERFRIAAADTFLLGKLYLPEHLRNSADMREFISQIKGVTHEGFTRSDDGPDLVSMLNSMYIITPSDESLYLETNKLTETSYIWANDIEEEDENDVAGSSVIF